MVTKGIKGLLCAVFGIATWPEFKAILEEARYPYPIRLTWRCIAKGKSRSGRFCIANEGLKEDPKIETSYVAEHFTYIRFNGSATIWRYHNPKDMQEELRQFDLTKETDLEEGHIFILEPIGKARSHKYAAQRRAAILAGEWEVTPRGPNPNKVKPIQHYFRPW
jgi:hypothetical protein